MFHMLQLLLSPLHPQAAAHPREWITPLSRTWGHLSSALESWADKIWAEHIYLFNVFLGGQALALGDHLLQIRIKSLQGGGADQGCRATSSRAHPMQAREGPTFLPQAHASSNSNLPSPASQPWTQGALRVAPHHTAEVGSEESAPQRRNWVPTYVSRSLLLWKVESPWPSFQTLATSTRLLWYWLLQSCSGLRFVWAHTAIPSLGLYPCFRLKFYKCPLEIPQR